MAFMTKSSGIGGAVSTRRFMAASMIGFEVLGLGGHDLRVALGELG
jgi:hypothetical protein